MLRFVSFCALALLSGAPSMAAAVGDNQQCVRELASVDRSFADAMRDLQRNAASEARCTSWRRQIDVMKKASDVFARCTVDEGRTTAIRQMEGSISDFRDMIYEAKCP
jgi:hypothetical protein